MMHYIFFKTLIELNSDPSQEICFDLASEGFALSLRGLRSHGHLSGSAASSSDQGQTSQTQGSLFSIFFNSNMNNYFR